MPLPNRILVSCLTLILTGCSGIVQMMPRDSGKIYSGTVHGSLFGSGMMTVTIDGEDYTGPIVRTSSNGGGEFIQKYGRGDLSFASLSAGVATVKGILSSQSGRGLRCEFVSTGDGGGGICVDDKSHIFDAIVTR